MIHNPDNVPDHELPEGYRFLDRDEIRLKDSHKLSPLNEIIMYQPPQSYNQKGTWSYSYGYKGNLLRATYATCLSREDLNEKRFPFYSKTLGNVDI